MVMMNETWTAVGGSWVSYRKADEKLEMTSLSPAIIGVIIILVISGIIELVLVLLSIADTTMLTALITVLIVLIIPPCFSLPWTPCRNYLIADTGSGELQILKKNVARKVISRKVFNIKDIKSIIIHVNTGQNTRYELSLKFKNNTELRIFTSIYLIDVRAVEQVLQSHVKDIVTSKTHLECDNMMIPIDSGEINSSTSQTKAIQTSASQMKASEINAQQSSTPQTSPILATPEPELARVVDHSEIEGVVYACPTCHALLCNACMKVYIARSLGCPRCGRLVLSSGASNETNLFEILDA